MIGKWSYHFLFIRIGVLLKYFIYFIYFIFSDNIYIYVKLIKFNIIFNKSRVVEYIISVDGLARTNNYRLHLRGIFHFPLSRRLQLIAHAKFVYRKVGNSMFKI